MFHVEHVIATSKVVNIRVHLLRSSKPQRCPTCGLRRILYAIALYPAGLAPETWQCAEDIGVRVPARDGAPDPLPGVDSIWAQTTVPLEEPIDKVEDFVASIEAPRDE
jgi:hypothetical protein